MSGSCITLTERAHKLFTSMAKSDTKAMISIKALPTDTDEFKEANATINETIDTMMGLGLMQDITEQCPRPNIDPVRQFRILQLTEQGILFFNEPKRSVKPN